MSEEKLQALEECKNDFLNDLAEIGSSWLQSTEEGRPNLVTLYLTDREIEVVDDLKKKLELSDRQLMLKALRMVQLWEAGKICLVDSGLPPKVLAPAEIEVLLESEEL